MGMGRRKLAPLWGLALALACARHTGHAHDGSSQRSYEHHPDLTPVPWGSDGDPLRGVTTLLPLRAVSVVRARNPAHSGRVCSTWGDFHYKTFDGDVFRFPGLCNYVFSAHCGAAYEDFNIQLRRGQESNGTNVTLSRVTMKLDGLVVELTKSSVLVDGRPVRLPFSHSGVLIQHSGGHVRVVARLGLVFTWNEDDSLLLELDAKYANQTCGLCGDFNGQPAVGEFLSRNTKLTPLEFGNLQKLDGPTERCQDPTPAPLNCSTSFGICEELLGGPLFAGCTALVDVGSYVDACRQDLCLCARADPLSCMCDTLAEYSRQCAHAGGQPQDWRSPDLCPQTCSDNMRYHECRSPCEDTCSNLEHSRACEDHCVAGCFCPEGTVLDDVGQGGCVPASQCACTYNRATYAPGAVYTTDCANCTCSGGRWSCREVPCPGTCSVLGGAHFSTFDEKQYTVHGDCSYVLAKSCNSTAFTVLAELRRCGLTDSETCLKSVTLSLDGAHTAVVVTASGKVFVNQIYTQLPVSAANVTVFRPSTFFIIAQTSLGLQLEIQLVPAMQLFVRLAPELRGLTCGLCGNFNQNQADDFTALSGVVEGTAAAFANTWKTQAACPNVRNSFEDPCSLSVENEKYAQHWCSRLTDTHGPFAQCHAAVSPDTYYSNCMFDTCNCEKSEDCMCAALSSYVRACAAKDVLLRGWRDGVCAKPTTTCPESMAYHYHVSTCQPTCRALSEGDVTCHVPFVPVDGCTCAEGTFLDDAGKCVPAASCPCYHRGSVVPSGESVHDSGAVCTCTRGTLSCIGGSAPTPVCAEPMVYFDCRNATPGAAGAGCQKSCDTLDMACYSPQCVPGCVCPDGLVADGEGGCIAVEDCPCVHNEASYQAGQTIRVGCNNCTCDKRLWRCTDDPCLATCTVYGDGHYLTFDGQRYSFSGDCEYTLVQGRVCGLCGNFDDNAINDFTTRSQSVAGNALEFGNSWKFSPNCPDAPAPKDPCTANPYRKSWAQKQCSIINGATFAACHAHVEPDKYYEACVSDACACDSGGDCECFCTAVAAYAQACHQVGLCVSWRTPDVCPLFCDYYNPEGLCEWHYQPCGAPCMRTCRNPRGDCPHDVRGLEGCYPSCPAEAPIFDEDEMQCVAECPAPPQPPPCRVHGKSYEPGAPVPSDKNCHSCVCSASGVQCSYNASACICTYDRRHFRPGDIIYHTTDGMGGCISAHCGANGTIDRRVYGCSSSSAPPPTTFSFSTLPRVVSSTPTASTSPSPAPSTAHAGPLSSTQSIATGTSSRMAPSSASVPPHHRCGEECLWSPWLDVSRPGRGIDSGDFDTLDNLRAHGHQVCRAPREVQCRAEDAPEVPLHVLGQRVDCSLARGLTCHNRDQASGLCDNYQIRVLCCTPLACPTSHGPTQTTPPAASRTAATQAPGSPAPSNTTGPATLSTAATAATTASSMPAPGTSTPSRTAVLTSSLTPGLTALTTPSGSPVVPGTSGATSEPPSPEPSKACHREVCSWTQWIDGSYPGPGRNSGDFDTFQNLRKKGYKFCDRPRSVECRAESFPDTPLAELGQNVTCNAREGLLCLNKDQLPPICYNYEIRIQCCRLEDVCTHGTTVPGTSATAWATSRETSAQTQTTVSTAVPSTPTEHTAVSSAMVPTPARTRHSTHAVTAPVTRDCQPRCAWTKWFDVDYPAPGPHGGDVETYNHIISRGERICHRPEDIAKLECRAENHPDVGLESLGQVVQCSRDVGLVCRNRDQAGAHKLCLNYQVRVLCCRTPDGCPLTTVPVTVLSTPSDRLYPAGSVIYRQTDLAGHCYYALCSWDCQVVRGADSACPSTTPPPSPKGETWAMANCSQATCEGNNVISLRPRQCPKVEEPTCANGYPALKVADRDGCCTHYQCQCVCSGWGDPHYITFDGTYYTFLDNCTYVLVQQIKPVHGHFRVLIDNYFCDAEDGLSCPKSIIVEHGRDRVVLTRTPVDGVPTNKIIFNNEVVSPGFQKNGIVVSRVGIKMYVTIPEIGLQVMFSGLIFSVEVPFSKFANNTEGQCGTCTNDQKDDCRLPGGAVATSCSKMSGLWNVTDPDQPSCHGPRQAPTTVGPTTVGPTSPSAVCPVSPICQLILSKVFEPCHAVIPPWQFYEGCAFDHCHMTDPEVVCSGLELYASLCASYGVCIDWRSQTNHTCSLTCPDDQVYQPCGPADPTYCHGNNNASLVVLPVAGAITEGCFCPKDMMFFSASTQACVPVGCPRCLGPRGEAMEPGQTVSVDCQECTCDGAAWTVTCRTKPCPPPPACPLPGLVPVPAAPGAGQCCPQYSCACNASHCPGPMECPHGSRWVLTHEEGACCPTQNCNWTVCSVNGTLYQPGAVVSSKLCETCRCEVAGGPQADTPVVLCETQICDTHCPTGFEYQARSGQCCGTCVQVACVTNTSGSTTHLFYPGETWSDPGNRCVTHECERSQDGLVVVTTRKACPRLSCALHQAQLGEDGCCLFCPPPLPGSTCAVHHEQQLIQQHNCSSAEPVRLAYCQGNCGDTASLCPLVCLPPPRVSPRGSPRTLVHESRCHALASGRGGGDKATEPAWCPALSGPAHRYSLEANALQHKCRCCQELRTSLRNVTLHCADGSRRAFSYTVVEECGCVGQHCPSPGDTSHSGEHERSEEEHSQETGGRSRRAGAQAPPAH
ncbi:PREDICTED: mucin-5AC [Propithecus coquereli]|uniref:mucin-5AC n=1 Tax=Propithecus coquereli TaxID=379532 RepID=UPI00063F4062|nr:PREDICTED: mucin-5AC [Propithecus coquereli]